MLALSGTPLTLCVLVSSADQVRIQDFWKVGHIYKGVGVRFADFISFFLNIP